MKKILILLLIFASFQTITAQNVTFGVKGGANFSSYNTNYGPIVYKYKLGFQLGGFVKIGLVERLYLQPELMYSLQGTKFDLSLVSLNLPQTLPGDDPLFKDNLENIKVNESTIALPIMFKYYFMDNFSAELGPQVDYLFKIKTKLDENLNTNSVKTDYGASEFNFGANLGVGYDFNENLSLGLRYNYGFNRLRNSELASVIGSKRSNSVFSLSLEYGFN